MATVICAALTTPHLSAESVNPEEALPVKLKSRKALYENRIQAAINPVQVRYRRDLEMMLAGYTRARDLDSALAVSEELKTLDGLEEPIKEDKVAPRKLVDLKQRYTADIQRAEAPIREHYERDLQDMIAEFTHSRELEAAVSVRSELDRFKLLQQKSDPDGLSAWLQRHLLVWKGENGYVEISFDHKKATVTADGREIMERPYTLKDEDTIEFDWAANDTNSFLLSKDRKSFVRASSAGKVNHGGKVKPR